jgi:hypothetical protein
MEILDVVQPKSRFIFELNTKDVVELMAMFMFGKEQNQSALLKGLCIFQRLLQIKTVCWVVMYSIISYCIISFRIVLYCIVLYCIVLYCIYACFADWLDNYFQGERQVYGVKKELPLIGALMLDKLPTLCQILEEPVTVCSIAL